MEVACGLVTLAGCGTEHQAVLSELTIEHPDVKPQALAAGVGLLDGGRRACVKAEGSRKESGGEGEEAGHLSPGLTAGGTTRSRLVESRSHTMMCLWPGSVLPRSRGWSSFATIPAAMRACHAS